MSLTLICVIFLALLVGMIIAYWRSYNALIDYLKKGDRQAMNDYKNSDLEARRESFLEQIEKINKEKKQ